MKLPVSRELDAIVADTLAPALEGGGFSRRGRFDFLRAVNDGMVQVLSLQTAEFETDTYLSWTYNMAAFVPECIEARGARRPDATPDAVGCYSRVRLGRLCPDRSKSEFWYELGSTGLPRSKEPLAAYDPQQPTSVRALVVSDAALLVLPHFDSITTHRALLAFCRTPQGNCMSAFEHLILELLVGEVEAAQRMFTRCFSDRPEVGAYVLRRFGIDLAIAP